MGCVCAKPSTLEDGQRDRNRVEDRRLSEFGVPREVVQRREGSSVFGDRNETAKPFLIDKNPSGSIGYPVDHSQNSKVKPEDVFDNSLSTISIVPKSREGEQIAAGWPSWLASVAGEALSGWIPRKADTFEKLDKIGQGTYSSVYKARDLIHSKLVALKRVRFDNLDPESVKFMAREILVLRGLDHPNIIKLEGLITSPASCSLYLIFEYMEHDLTGLSSIPGNSFTEPQVKCYMKQLLSGLEYCHSHGVLHRDIKGSNLLIDDSGILKLADFGLATYYDPRDDTPMTSRVVTLWFRPPELLLGATRYSDAIDLWSAGCILGELYSGKPLMPGRTEVEQLHKIFKLCGTPPEEFWIKSRLRHAALFKPHQPYRRRIADRFKDIPASALQLIETLLSIDPASRGTATAALHSEFFTTEPLACDPSSLPKYPPSKEIDVKMREDEKKRREADEGRGKFVDLARQEPEQYEAALADRASADLITSVQMQERKRQSFLTTRNQTFNSYVQEPSSNLPSDHFRNPETTREVGKEIIDQIRRRGLHSGPLTRGGVWPNTERRIMDPVIAPREPRPSALYTSTATRTRMAENHRPGPSLYQDPFRRVDRLDPAINEDRMFHSHSTIYSNQNEDYLCVTRPVMNNNKYGYGSSDEHNIHYSGPLMLRPRNADDILRDRDRDRRIQEAARRGARVEKPNHSRVVTNQLLVSRR